MYIISGGIMTVYYDYKTKKLSGVEPIDLLEEDDPKAEKIRRKLAERYKGMVFLTISPYQIDFNYIDVTVKVENEIWYSKHETVSTGAAIKLFNDGSGHKVITVTKKTYHQKLKEITEEIRRNLQKYSSNKNLVNELEKKVISIKP